MAKIKKKVKIITVTKNYICRVYLNNRTTGPPSERSRVHRGETEDV